LSSLLFPDDAREQTIKSTYRPLRGVLGTKHVRVDSPRFGLFNRDGPLLALSPDGRYAIATLPVLNVPHAWATLYPPPSSSDAYRLGRPGVTVREFVKISLQTGSITSLTSAPISNDAGLWAIVFSRRPTFVAGHFPQVQRRSTISTVYCCD
jgi:hypothetical protein